MMSLKDFLNQHKQKENPDFIKCTVKACNIKTDYELFLSDLSKE